MQGKLSFPYIPFYEILFSRKKTAQDRKVYDFFNIKVEEMLVNFASPSICKKTGFVLNIQKRLVSIADFIFFFLKWLR